MRLFSLFVIAAGLCHAQRTDGSFERSLKVTGPVDLDLATDAGGINVVPGPAGSVHIRGILKAGGNWFNRGDVEGRIRELEAHPPIEQNGNTIRVAVRDPSLLKGIAMRLEIEAPAESRLRARADSGGIDVRGIRGPVDCKTDSGGIRVTDIGGEVRAAADSGAFTSGGSVVPCPPTPIPAASKPWRLPAASMPGPIPGASGSLRPPRRRSRRRQTPAASISPWPGRAAMTSTLAPAADGSPLRM